MSCCFSPESLLDKECAESLGNDCKTVHKFFESIEPVGSVAGFVNQTPGKQERANGLKEPNANLQDLRDCFRCAIACATKLVACASISSEWPARTFGRDFQRFPPIRWTECLSKRPPMPPFDGLTNLSPARMSDSPYLHKVSVWRAGCI